MKLKFWLRWAGRDLRQRWLQVAAIALIIALGTGIYAGFGGQETWRVASLDKSYAALNMYDLRLTLTTGSYLPQEEAVAVLSVVKGVTAVEPRLLDEFAGANHGGRPSHVCRWRDRVIPGRPSTHCDCVCRGYPHHAGIF